MFSVFVTPQVFSSVSQVSTEGKLSCGDEYFLLSLIMFIIPFLNSMHDFIYYIIYNGQEVVLHLKDLKRATFE